MLSVSSAFFFILQFAISTARPDPREKSYVAGNSSSLQVARSQTADSSEIPPQMDLPNAMREHTTATFEAANGAQIEILSKSKQKRAGRLLLTEPERVESDVTDVSDYLRPSLISIVSPARASSSSKRRSKDGSSDEDRGDRLRPRDRKRSRRSRSRDDKGGENKKKMATSVPVLSSVERLGETAVSTPRTMREYEVDKNLQDAERQSSDENLSSAAPGTEWFAVFFVSVNGVVCLFMLIFFGLMVGFALGHRSVRQLTADEALKEGADLRKMEDARHADDALRTKGYEVNAAEGTPYDIQGQDPRGRTRPNDDREVARVKVKLGPVEYGPNVPAEEDDEEDEE